MPKNKAEKELIVFNILNKNFEILIFLIIII